MGSIGLRNEMGEDNYTLEYLIYGRFHRAPCPIEGEDELGYRSKRWTSLEALQELEAADVVLARPVAKFLEVAKSSHASFAESLPEPPLYQPGTETQLSEQTELSEEF